MALGLYGTVDGVKADRRATERPRFNGIDDLLTAAWFGGVEMEI